MNHSLNAAEVSLQTSSSFKCVYLNCKIKGADIRTRYVPGTCQSFMLTYHTRTTCRPIYITLWYVHIPRYVQRYVQSSEQTSWYVHVPRYMQSSEQTSWYVHVPL